MYRVTLFHLKGIFHKDFETIVEAHECYEDVIKEDDGDLVRVLLSGLETWELSWGRRFTGLPANH